MSEPIKALTLWQPWASLMAFSEKHVETRCWQTKYRGPMVIHAAAKMPPNFLGNSRHGERFQQCLTDIGARRGWNPLHGPFGAALCIVKLVDIELTEEVRDDLSEQERVFGNYEDGRYAWFTEMLEVFVVPIPARGNRLLWNWNGRRP